MKLENKVAIITGGGSGIGQTSSILFAREGAKIVVVDINEDSGLETVEKIKSNGGESCFIKTDVSDVKDVQNSIKYVIDQYSKIDVLFNNAGIISPIGMSFLEISEKQWDKMLNTNLKSMFLYTKYAVPYLKKTHGVIVNTSSISGVIIIPDFLDYSVAKAGVIHLTKASAIELTKMNIRVNCICPGPVNTPMLAELSKHPSSTTANPMNRIASPEEIANVALFLASSDSSFITGQAIIADGGYTVI
mgnify:FL=1